MTLRVPPVGPEASLGFLVPGLTLECRWCAVQQVAETAEAITGRLRDHTVSWGTMSAQQGVLPRDDPSTVRLAPVPDAAPPYDGDPCARTGVPAAIAKAPRPVATICPSPVGAETGAADWSGRFAQVLAEALAGSRPARQIMPWTTERARVHFRRIGSLLACGQQPRVLRVVTSRPAPDVMEMTIVAGFGPRTRAVAARFERTTHQPTTPGRPPAPTWLCTDIESA